MFSVLGSSPRSPSRRFTLATAGLLAASGLSFTTTSADAALTGVGPIDPATNFPSFYRDDTQLALQPCLDGPPLCVGTAEELFAAGGEGFYYSANTSVGGFDMRFVLEMAYDDVTDEPIVFQRLQFASRDELLRPNSRYVILHPFGESECFADASGNVANRNCRTQVGGPGGDFSTALAGPMSTFLVWDTLGDSASGPPAGYIGDGDSTPHTVEGGRFRNSVQVTGPDVNATTELFNVYGKLAPGPMGSTSRRSIDFGAVTGPTSSHLAYRSIGTQAIGVGSVTASGPFTITANTCNGVSLDSGAQCDIDVTFTPTPGAVATGAVTIADQSGSKVIPLSGKGRLGVATLSKGSVVMADTKVGKERSDVVTVTNTGDLDLALEKPRFAGRNRYDFRRGLTENACASGVTLAPGASCNVRVVFAPRAKRVRTAVLAVATGVGTQVISLAGTGVGKDRVVPVLKGASPKARAKRVDRRSDVVATFSEAVRGVDKGSMRLVNTKSGKAVRVKVEKLSGDTWRLDPKGKLAKHTAYKVRLNGSRSGIRDKAGNPLKDVTWQFRTE